MENFWFEAKISRLGFPFSPFCPVLFLLVRGRISLGLKHESCRGWYFIVSCKSCRAWTRMFMCMVVDRLHFSCGGWIVDRLHPSCSGWIVDQLHFSCSGWTGPWTLSETSGKWNLGLLMRMRECKSVTAELSPRWTSCFRPASERSGKLGNLG